MVFFIFPFPLLTFPWPFPYGFPTLPNPKMILTSTMTASAAIGARVISDVRGVYGWNLASGFAELRSGKKLVRLSSSLNQCSLTNTAPA